ncbi:MAG: ShlB/FhaC/HecB family hemolysin secretion/activation protein [Gammaproteobacteria bacterium]|nr:ShlB/FhaC/HecB family hemolysin secretion/activation protein [Gammaproteobacteria bacterium]
MTLPPIQHNRHRSKRERNATLALLRSLVVALTITPITLAAETAEGVSDRFAIQRFAILGGTILPAAELDALVAPFTGPAREYGDIQRALEAVEFAYRQRGYAAVQVYVPEQDITEGVVIIEVSESVIGAVTIEPLNESAQTWFNAENLRASLPALQEGETPNAFKLSSEVALANENPAKQLEVVLALAEAEGEVNARILVNASNPLRLNLSLDNSGNDQTGRHRLGMTLQHANLWNRDHVGSVAYQTSPEKPDKVEIFSLSYRLPLYAVAGALDFIYAKSTVDAGVTQTTAGDLSFAGSGQVLGLRYTHALPRRGDMTQKLIIGWDNKSNDNECSLGDFGAAGCGAAASDVTLRPLSLTYQRTTLAPGAASEGNVTLVYNLPGGSNGEDADFAASRPSPDGAAGATADYKLIKGSYTYFTLLPDDWQLRLVGQAQYSPQPLVGQEQMGMSGSRALRGFLDREVSRDRGVMLNLEGYTPDFATKTGLPGSLRALAFVDAATGKNELLQGEVQPPASLASGGFGLRYVGSPQFDATLDMARVITANGTQEQGDTRSHFTLNVNF